jgi:hypothetical protein
VFVHCAHCQTEFAPGDDRCPTCQSDDIMIGMKTPSGTRVSGPRDAPRMRLQGRHKDDGHTEYIFSIGAPPPRTAGRAPVAPHIKMYNDIRWNHDRQRMERRAMYVDSDNDYYKQEWFSLETGEPTYVKEGRLSDLDVHGKSARRGKNS